MPSLKVKIGSLELKNPVITASGTFGYGEEFLDFYHPRELGAFVTKGLSINPREGNPPPRIYETPSGMLNAIGLQNIGIQKFIEEKLPKFKGEGCVIISNFFGSSPEEYGKAASMLDKADGVDGLEANISCPNVEGEGKYFGSNPRSVEEITRICRENTKKPLIMKLTPEVSDIAEVALAAEGAGADAVSIINTIPAMSIDVESRRPRLANITGGLSGPAIRPVAVRMVYEAAKAIKIPIIGIGGIICAIDALEFILAGACAVQVGTGNFLEPKAPLEIIKGLKTYLNEHNIEDINELVAGLKDA